MSKGTKSSIIPGLRINEPIVEIHMPSTNATPFDQIKFENSKRNLIIGFYDWILRLFKLVFNAFNFLI